MMDPSRLAIYVLRAPCSAYNMCSCQDSCKCGLRLYLLDFLSVAKKPSYLATK